MLKQIRVLLINTKKAHRKIINFTLSQKSVTFVLYELNSMGSVGCSGVEGILSPPNKKSPAVFQRGFFYLLSEAGKPNRLKEALIFIPESRGTESFCFNLRCDGSNESRESKTTAGLFQKNARDTLRKTFHLADFIFLVIFHRCLYYVLCGGIVVMLAVFIIVFIIVFVISSQ